MRTEDAVGVSKGSMARRERRISGVETVSRGESVAWRTVTGRMEGGQMREGRERSEARRERGESLVGVRMSCVRMMSSGARSRPAIPEAATTIPMVARGKGDSRTSIPPLRRPGSGTSRTAARRERVQDSMVLRRTE